MKPSTIAIAAVAALTPVILVNASADASDTTRGPDGAGVVDSGPHEYIAVTEVTPDIRKRFPDLGSLSEKVPAEQLQRGGPALTALTGVDTARSTVDK